MRGPVRVTAPGVQIARICANAGAFVPAAAQVKMLALRSLAGRLEARGTDSYAAGVDSVEAETTGVCSVALSREDLTAVERAARGAAKEAVTVEIAPDSVSVTWAGVAGAPAETLSVPCAPYPAAWAELDRLMNRDYDDARPAFSAFDPALFSRFAKVRAEKDRVMDLWFAGAELPVLVKIGESFRGLVMPLYREKAAEYTPEGLW